MAEQYLGEIRMVGFNFAPVGWALCEGQILSIQSNAALFALLGTTYGGNGTSTFGLPNFQSRVPVGVGQGAGLSNYAYGQVGGTETVTLLTNQMPSHNHPFSSTGATATVQAGSGTGTVGTPAGNYLVNGGDATGAGLGEVAFNFAPQAHAGTLANIAGVSLSLPAATALGATGGNLPHPNLQPYLAVYFIIATIGLFPARS
jgi:microcystin-dependent protein